MRETVAAMQDFAAFTGQTRHDPAPQAQGLMSLTTKAEGAAEQRETVAHQRSIGVDGIELLDGDEARARFPYLAPEVLQARYVWRTGCWTSASSRSGLLQAARACVTQTRVIGFDIRDGLTAVHTDRGTISTRACVIACGPMSGVVAAAGRRRVADPAPPRHKLVLPDVPAVPQWAPLTFDEDTGAHWRPAGTGARLLISVADQAPRRGRRRPRPRRRTSSTRCSTPTARPRWRGSRRSGARSRRATTGPCMCGLYTVTPDSSPADRRDAGPRPLRQHRLQRPRRDVEHRRRPPPARAHHRHRRRQPFALDRTFVPPRGKTR